MTAERCQPKPSSSINFNQLNLRVAIALASPAALLIYYLSLSEFDRSTALELARHLDVSAVAVDLVAKCLPLVVLFGVPACFLVTTYRMRSNPVNIGLVVPVVFLSLIDWLLLDSRVNLGGNRLVWLTVGSVLVWVAFWRILERNHDERVEGIALVTALCLVAVSWYWFANLDSRFDHAVEGLREPPLVAEVVATVDNRPTVGYVIGESRLWLTVLTAEDRSILRIATSKVTSRTSCASVDRLDYKPTPSNTKPYNLCPNR